MRWTASIRRGCFALGLAGLVLASASPFSLPAWPLDTPEARATLKGISRLRIKVDQDTPGVDSDGLRRDQLQRDVESRLQRAGIALADLTLATEPLLWVVLTTDKVPEFDLYAVSIKVALFQYVRLWRGPELGAPAATWELEAVGSVPSQEPSELRTWVRDFVDRFIAAYHEQNPKK